MKKFIVISKFTGMAGTCYQFDSAGAAYSAIAMTDVGQELVIGKEYIILAADPRVVPDCDPSEKPTLLATCLKIQPSPKAWDKVGA